MARIAMICDDLTTSAAAQLNLEMMQALLDQQHELGVLTSLDQNLDQIPIHPRLSLLKPFRRWSAWEIVPVMRWLMQFRPEILLVTQPATPAARKWVGAINLLSCTSEMLRRPLIMTSIHDSKKWRQGLAIAVPLSDLITVCTSSDKAALENELGPKAAGRIELLPIAHWGVRPDLIGKNQAPDVPFQRWIMVPGQMCDHTDLSTTAEIVVAILSDHPEWGVLFVGGWDDVPKWANHQFMAKLRDNKLESRAHWTGRIDYRTETSLFRQAHFVLLSPLKHTNLKIGHDLRRAIALRKPVLISCLQQSCFTLPAHSKLWIWSAPAAAASDHAFHFAEYLELAADINEFNHTATPTESLPIDNLGNFLNRLLVERLRSLQ